MSQYRTCERGRCVSRGIFRAAPNEPPAASEWAPVGTFPISSPLYIVWVYGTRRDAWANYPWHSPRSLRVINGCNKYLHLLMTAWLRSSAKHNKRLNRSDRRLTWPAARLEVGSREELLHLQLCKSHPLHLLLMDFLNKSGNTTSEH